MVTVNTTDRGKGNEYTLNDFVNEPDVITIGKKKFQLRDLTMRELIKLQGLLQNVADVIQATIKPLSLWERIRGVKRRNLIEEGKATEDFKVIKLVLDICNPDEPFTASDFNDLTKQQTQVLLKIILERNYFFDRKNPGKEVEAKP